MAETIRSIVEGAIDQFTPIDRQRLVNSGVYRQVMSTLNEETDGSGAVALPGEGNLTLQDLDRRVEDERVQDVRAVVGVVIKRIADQANLG